MASVTIRDEAGALRTEAPTDEAASAAGQAQYEAREGPCLDAIDEPVVHTPSLPDQRWPVLADRPLDAGVYGAVSYRLALNGPISDDSLGGSLNAYAAAPNAFDDEAVEIGLILAAHASVAVRAIRQREAVEQLSSDLRTALSSRDVIGQAKGILMERLRITPEDAFDVLRRASQRLNVKLREIAQTLSDTGELDQPS
jgi:GAF domain-containing protein